MEYTEMDKVIQNIVDEIKQECIIENTAHGMTFLDFGKSVHGCIFSD